MRRCQITALVMVLMMIAAGCGQTASKSAKETSEGSVHIQDFAGRDITFDKVPEKIVALSNGDMSIVYALGGEVVGRPSAELPSSLKKAEHAKQIGTTHQMDLEQITSLKPDVVLGNKQLNEKDISSIEGIGSKLVLTQANSVKDIQKQITLFGKMLNKPAQAKKLNNQIDQKIASLKGSSKGIRTLVVYGAPGTYMSALPNSLSGNLLELVGGKNIAADAPAIEQFPQYAQINTENVIRSDPDLILLMTHGNAEEVKKGFLNEMEQNPAWNDVKAVKEGRIEILPNDLFGTNPGAAVIDALDYLEKKMRTAAK